MISYNKSNINYKRKDLRLVIVSPLMRSIRYHYDLTSEISKYHEVIWLNGWIHHTDCNIDKYITKNHKIIVFNQGVKLKKRGGGFIDEIKFVFLVIRHLKNYSPDLVIIHSHRMAFLYPILYKSTQYVLQLFIQLKHKQAFIRMMWKIIDWLNNRFYDTFFVLSEPLIESFNIKKGRIYVTNWSFYSMSDTLKKFDDVKLLYVGVLSERRIHETITGLKTFIEQYGRYTKIKYDIIGQGNNQEIQMINDTIANNDLSSVVKYHGYLSDEKVIEFFNTSNIGVSYVPINKYYTNNPVFKTHEYLLSGLAVIATDTNENRKLINCDNGVLVQDNPFSFTQGLIRILKNLKNYNSEIIRNTVKQHSVIYHVKHKLVPIVNEIANKK